jgi:hypothetical protein
MSDTERQAARALKHAAWDFIDSNGSRPWLVECMSNMLEAMGMQHAAFYVRDAAELSRLTEALAKARQLETASVELTGWDEWTNDDAEQERHEAPISHSGRGACRSRPGCCARGQVAAVDERLEPGDCGRTGSYQAIESRLVAEEADGAPPMMFASMASAIGKYRWEDFPANPFHDGWLNITTDPNEAPDDCDPWALPDGWDWECRLNGKGYYASGPNALWTKVGRRISYPVYDTDGPESDPVAESVRQLVIERNR